LEGNCISEREERALLQFQCRICKGDRREVFTAAWVMQKTKKKTVIPERGVGELDSMGERKYHKH